MRIGKWIRRLIPAVFFGCLLVSCSAVELPSSESSRTLWTAKIEDAAEANPSNIQVLTEALFLSDWYIATMGAAKLGQLVERGRLEPSQATTVKESLNESLGRTGQWYLLRWDEEDPDYGAFRSAAIYALSRFGSDALSSIEKLMVFGNIKQKEAACWVLVELKADNVTIDVTTHNQLVRMIDSIASESPGSDLAYCVQRLRTEVDKGL